MEFDRLITVDDSDPCSQVRTLLKTLRAERGISQLQLAEHAGVRSSVVHRAERGADAKLSTWGKLFAGLGYRLMIDAAESSEDAGGFLLEEAERRQDRRLGGLRSGQRHGPRRTRAAGAASCRTP
ncbi:MAG: helix-turn-helix transcriptional regulator [Elusimicrobiota bacterium]